MNENRKQVSEKIIQLMDDKHVSYREVAEKTGIAKSSLQRYVTNTSSKIPMENIIKLSKMFGVSVAWLMGLNETNLENDKQSSSAPFGLNEELEEYLTNKNRSDLYELYKNVSESDSLRILMDSASDLTPHDLEPVLILIQGIRKAKGLD